MLFSFKVISRCVVLCCVVLKSEMAAALENGVDYKRVLLYCVRVKSKLRVIIDPKNVNYNHRLFCSISRQLRHENAIFSVPENDITFIQSKANRTNYYRVKTTRLQHLTNLVEQTKSSAIEKSNFVLYQDTEEQTCAICFTENKFYVFQPCGHYYICETCYRFIQKECCPICRRRIIRAIPYNELHFE
jgi:hypothetical protein